MTDAGKKALEELVAGVGGDMFLSGTTKVSPDRIRAVAAYVATLEARATAVEERVKRLEVALKPYVDATKYNGAGAFYLNTALLSEVDHRWAHHVLVTEPAMERAALTGDKR